MNKEHGNAQWVRDDAAFAIAKAVATAERQGKSVNWLWPRACRSASAASHWPTSRMPVHRGWSDRDCRAVMLLPQERVGVDIKVDRTEIDRVLGSDPPAPTDVTFGKVYRTQDFPGPVLGLSRT